MFSEGKDIFGHKKASRDRETQKKKKKTSRSNDKENTTTAVTTTLSYAQWGP